MFKNRTLLIACTVFAGSLAAQSIIDPEQLPDPVRQALQDYFPDSQILSLERDADDGETIYELDIQYREIRLEVEISERGKVLEVDSE